MLSKKTKYGLKALIHIVKNRETEPIAISTIAKEEQISVKFLESIMLSLKKSGFLSSKKGKKGGYYLIKEPAEIRMVDIFRSLEGPVAMVPCVSLNFYETCDDCQTEAECNIHKLMLQVRDSTLDILRGNTLEDLAAE